ncbi:MAG TPA: glycosyltransferase family 9 protein [Blastocatellia bacterium]|nr:glycosyltransferase family 9 protein [Blastocatellia bacterium]
MQLVAKHRRILVYRPGQIGDTLIALPALWAVRHHFPQAHLCLLTDRHPQSKFILATQVLPTEGLFDDWMSYPANELGVEVKIFPKLWWQIRQRKFDTLVYLVARNRSPKQVQRDLLFFQLAGIKHFFGHQGIEPFPERQSDRTMPTVTNEADHLLQRLELSGIRIPNRGHRPNDLRLTEAEHQHAQHWLAKRRGNTAISTPMIAIGPGSKWPSKVWPEERYAELVAKLIEEWQVMPVIFGGKEDREVGDRLIGYWGTGLNAAGELNVRQAAAAMTHCVLYIGNDTGTMHLAATAGLPCVAIFAAVDWPGRWTPYGSNHMILRRSLPCEGCRLHVCTDQNMECLRQIKVVDVYAAAQKQMQKIFAVTTA